MVRVIRRMIGLVLLLSSGWLLYAEPLHEAVLAGSVRQVRQILSVGADPNALDSSGLSPLHWAIRDNQRQIAEILLENGAAVNQRTGSADGTSYTPLHFAAFEGNSALVQLLLDNGAELSARSASGNTPLHVAATQNHVNIVSLLLERGASPRTRNNRGLRAADVAPAQSGSLEMIQLLNTQTVIFRVPIYYSYVQPFDSGSIQNLGDVLKNIRPGVAAQLTFPVEQIALGFEIGAKLGIGTTGVESGVLSILENYVHFITRFNIPTDTVTIEVSPTVGAFMSLFNGQILITPDVGLRMGFTNKDADGSIIIDVHWISPGDLLGLGSTIYADLWSNALHISVGYSFGF